MSQNYHPSIRYSQFWNISIHPVKVQFIADLFVDISSIKINIAFIGSGDSHNYCILIRWFNFNFFAACATICKRYQKWNTITFLTFSGACLVSWSYLFSSRKLIDHPVNSSCKIYRSNNRCRCYISLLWQIWYNVL